MSTQPEALRLAEWLDGHSNGPMAAQKKAAAELRRLHAVNTELLEALSSIDVYLSDTLSGRVIPDPATYKQWIIDGIIEARNRAHAAIAKATGEQA